jgi:hypothetical protein
MLVSPRFSVRISAGKPIILAEILRGFPQSLQATAGILVESVVTASFQILSNHISPVFLSSDAVNNEIINDETKSYS